MASKIVEPIKDRLAPKADMTFIVSVIGVLTLICMFLGPDHFHGLEEEKMAMMETDGRTWATYGISGYIINRLYFVMTTLSTVGYGDISPKSGIAKLLGILMMWFMVVIAVL